jgi:hypothetical protein
MLPVDKANKVLWLVKMREELALAALAVDSDEVEFHRQLAREFEFFANTNTSPEVPLNTDLKPDR